jgi:hypothetical protein
MRDSTLNQRIALSNMWSALDWRDKLRTLHDLSFDQASKEIDRAKKYIDENGFPNRDGEEEL